MAKKAFTLIELAIVVIVIGIVMGGVLTTSSTIMQNQKYSSTKEELENIKTSLISYVATYGKLPYPDANNDGDGQDTDDSNAFPTTAATINNLPYLDIQSKSKDPYGMAYYYDVNDELITSDDNNVCNVISRINISSNGDYPRVADDTATPVEKYAVAAIILSSGEDKTLTGQNADAGRVYEMNLNKYDESDNNDLVVELSIFELLGDICDLSDLNTSN